MIAVWFAFVAAADGIVVAYILFMFVYHYLSDTYLASIVAERILSTTSIMLNG